MQIPPTSPGSNFPSAYPVDPLLEAAQTNQEIQNDLNKLMRGKLTPGEAKLVSFDLQKQMDSLGKLESKYPRSFTKDQKSITNDLQAQIEKMSEQMDPPSQQQLREALETSEQLHF